MNAINRTRAVLFDLDGTLRHNRPDSNQVFFDHACALGLTDSEDGRRRALRWAHAYFAQSEELLQDRESFGDDEGAFWKNYARRYLTAFGCPPARVDALAAQIHEYMAEEYQPEDWVPPEVPGILQSLQAAGYTVGVVSNRHEPLEDYLQSLELRQYLDFTLAAGEVGSWKPDGRIFSHALALAGVEAGEAMYIGDNYFADVVGAGRAGLRPVLVDPLGIFPEAECTVLGSVGELLRRFELNVS